jgi:hypothetical protein
MAGAHRRRPVAGNSSDPAGRLDHADLLFSTRKPLVGRLAAR